jgi:hypothetical protein
VGFLLGSHRVVLVLSMLTPGKGERRKTRKIGKEGMARRWAATNNQLEG